VGMWIFLITDAMTFGGLLIGYGILRAGNNLWPTPSSILGIRFTAVMTFVLIVSSLFMVIALDWAKKGNAKLAARWLVFAGGGALVCLCGQVYESPPLLREGSPPQAGTFPATFYVVTSFHGAHVFTGVCYLLVTALGVARGKHLERGANFVEITGL